jgi:hypothetical protein
LDCGTFDSCQMWNVPERFFACSSGALYSRIGQKSDLEQAIPCLGAPPGGRPTGPARPPRLAVRASAEQAEQITPTLPIRGGFVCQRPLSGTYREHPCDSRGTRRFLFASGPSAPRSTAAYRSRPGTAIAYSNSHPESTGHPTACSHPPVLSSLQPRPGGSPSVAVTVGGRFRADGALHCR